MTAVCEHDISVPAVVWSGGACDVESLLNVRLPHSELKHLLHRVNTEQSNMAVLKVTCPVYASVHVYTGQWTCHF